MTGKPTTGQRRWLAGVIVTARAMTAESRTVREPATPLVGGLRPLRPLRNGARRRLEADASGALTPTPPPTRITVALAAR